MTSKRMPIILALGTVVVSAVLCWFLPLSKTSQAAPAPAAEAAFKGKLLLVQTNNYMAAFLLEKAQLQKMGDQSCLVGKGAAGGKMTAWCKGRTVWLRMEHIVSITEFEDLKDAKKALESGVGMPYGGYAVTPSSDPSPLPVPSKQP